VRAATEVQTVHSAHAAIRHIDKEIVLEGVRLAKFNINYYLQVNKHYRGRNILYPSVQECGTGASYANSIIDLYQRSANVHHPELQNTSTLKQGAESNLTGQAVKSAGFVFELLQNARFAQIAARKGYSPKRAAMFVQDSAAKIERLLKERELLVAKESADQKVLGLEGRLMQHLRNELIYEFKIFSARSREQEWQENTFYMLATAQNLSLMSSTIAGIQGFSVRNLTGGIAINNIVASSIGVMAPELRTLAGMAVHRYWSGRLSKLLPAERQTPRTMQQLEADWNDLAEYIRNSPSQQADAQSVLGMDAELRLSNRADAALEVEQQNIQHLRRVAQEQAISGPPIEMATLARQICQEVAYSSFRENRYENNRINIGGRISQTSGQTYSLIITPTSAIRAAMLHNKLRQRGELPSQQLEARLNRLDNLEGRLQSLDIQPK
jgi:hypothetical protein